MFLTYTDNNLLSADSSFKANVETFLTFFGLNNNFLQHLLTNLKGRNYPGLCRAFCLFYDFLKVERTPPFAIYSTQFQVLVLIDILKFVNWIRNLFSAFSKWWFDRVQKLWVLEVPKKCKIFEEWKIFNLLQNFGSFECSMQWEVLLVSPNSYFVLANQCDKLLIQFFSLS